MKTKELKKQLAARLINTYEKMIPDPIMGGSYYDRTSSIIIDSLINELANLHIKIGKLEDCVSSLRKTRYKILGGRRNAH